MTRFAITHVPALLGNGAIDRLFENFFENPESYVKQTTNGYPLTDIYKNEDGSQVIEMALAGFNKDDLEIEVKENTISIRHETEVKPDERPPRRIARRSFTKTFVDYNNTFNLSK